jgi:hypothetical protein
MASKKIKLDEEAISEILVADTDFFLKKAQICASNFFPAAILDP